MLDGNRVRNYRFLYSRLLDPFLLLFLCIRTSIHPGLVGGRLLKGQVRRWNHLVRSNLRCLDILGIVVPIEVLEGIIVAGILFFSVSFDGILILRSNLLVYFLFKLFFLVVSRSLIVRLVLVRDGLMDGLCVANRSFRNWIRSSLVRYPIGRIYRGLLSFQFLPSKVRVL